MIAHALPCHKHPSRKDARPLVACADGQARVASRRTGTHARLLDELAISATDDVVEFAPGLGITARFTLARQPRTYTAIERDRDAAAVVEAYLQEPHQRCVLGTAEGTGLADSSASVVYGEAMLSMQPPSEQGANCRRSDAAAKTWWPLRHPRVVPRARRR